MSELAILCVTRAEPAALDALVALKVLAGRANADLVVAGDGEAAVEALRGLRMPTVVPVRSKGYIESVLDAALEACDGADYVLRLDDDEHASLAMTEWLAARAYLPADNWQFFRAHLWDARIGRGVIKTPHLWPDFQTRLAVRSKAGGRSGVHQGSPFGCGETAPVYIEHYKFVVRDYVERLAIARRYDAYASGYGTGSMRFFSLPESSYEQIEVVAPGDGRVPWAPVWTETVVMPGAPAGATP